MDSADIDHMRSLGLAISNPGQQTGIFSYHRGLDGAGDRPILVLIHGYPQSNFMWRHIVPLLEKDVPLFIPDIPGYGRSLTLTGPHDKRSVGQAILHGLRSLIQHDKEQPIVIAGHDRGARICHRIAVDNGYANMKILGTALLDIVPSLIQWQAFGNPAAVVGSFHWPFLANVSVATSLINAQGGDKWVEQCLTRWPGKNSVGLQKFRENNAVKVYMDSFKPESVIRASCDDYRAGAQEDLDEQRKDQEQGRKLDMDTLLIYSDDYIGKRYNMEKVWMDWMGKGKLDITPVRDSIGHFVAEEAPETTASAIAAFYNRVASQ
ncbi:putative Fluoroacetate dehalogenase [Xylogone sp. PMI_703]|nr:putative Fluoroacetate dehalogenase [Xylogone sp. PMI_703]